MTSFHDQDVPQPLENDHFGLRDFLNVALVWILGIAGMYLFVARPVISEVSQLKTQVNRIDADMLELSGSRQNAWKTNDLLSALNQQSYAVQRAEKSLQEIRDLRIHLEDEATHLPSAQNGLANIANLREQVIVESARLNKTRLLIADLQQFASENETFANELASVSTDLDAMQQKLADLQKVKTTVVTLSQDVDSAQSVANRLTTLSNGLVSEETNVTSAEKSLSQMNNLHASIIASQSATEEATTQADSLVRLQNKLVGQTETLYNALETLETMTDFQDLMGQQIAEIERIRREMIDIAALEPAVNQAMKTIRPLLEMTQLRRLNASEMREVAHNMLRQRAQANEEMVAESNNNEGYIPITRSRVEMPLTPMPEENHDGFTHQITAVPDPIDLK
jgi:myosin heavy subunit